MDEPDWAMLKLPGDRLPGPVLLRPAEEHDDQAEVARRGRSEAARDLQEAGHPAEGADDPRRRRGRRGRAGRGREGERRVAVDAVFDSVSVGTTFQKELKKAGVIFCSISEAIREHPELVQEVSRLGRAAVGQLLRDAELGGILGRIVRLCAAGRALPDGAVDLFPHQCREYRPVRADADHRRQGLLRLLPRRLHGAASATRRSCTRRWSRSSSRRMRR